MKHMMPDAIRTHAPTVTATTQREAILKTGFLCSEGLGPDAWPRPLDDLASHPAPFPCSVPPKGEI